MNEDRFVEVPSYRGVRCFVCNSDSYRKSRFRVRRVCIGDRWINSGTCAVMHRGKMYFRDNATYWDEAVRRHEYCHVLQRRRDWFQYLRYVLASVWYGYEKNPYEIEACRLETIPVEEWDKELLRWA